MDAFLLQVLNGLDKGGAYALIALGLTLVFGTLGVVNFAHGALFMLGAFCAVSLQSLLTLERVVLDPEKLTAWGTPMEVRTPYIVEWFGDFGMTLIDWSVPLAILLAVPIMLLLGVIMESRGRSTRGSCWWGGSGTPSMCKAECVVWPSARRLACLSASSEHTIS